MKKQTSKKTRKLFFIFLTIILPLSLLSFILNDKYYQSNELKIFQSCEIDISDTIPLDSTLVIGHAYGSPFKNSEIDHFIDKDAQALLKQHSARINRVIFSGDVFAIPSLKKWKKLNNDYKDSFEISIAPGNHDYLSLDSRKIFNLSPFGNKYPLIINDANHLIIIENSIKNNWKIQPSMKNLINDDSLESVIVIRHNTPIKELLPYINSKAGMSKSLHNYSEFSNIIGNAKKIYWIIGDSGAFKALPRMKCLKKDNHTFILNGLGGTPNDQILILANGNFSSYKLSKSNNS